MSANKKIETICIDLDSLLDTRFGVLRQRKGEEYARRILTPEYLVRDIDEFEGVSVSEFQEMYKARDAETLKYSVITAMVTRLKDMTGFLSELAINSPDFGGIKLAVNVYPYRLDDAVLKEIGRSVSVWTGGLVPVELVNIPLQTLTPAYVLNHFATLFMYEYQYWLDMHSAAFNETRLHEIHLIAPAIYFNEKPDEKTLKELIREAAHPFQATMMLLTPFIGIELVDVKWFSLVSPNRAP